MNLWIRLNMNKNKQNMTTQTKTSGRFCKKCGKRKFFQKFCIRCVKRTNSDIKIRDSIKLRKYKHETKKFLVEVISGWFPTKGKLAKKLPEGVNKSRVIDREKDEYHEVVKKYGTEEVTHECHESLSQHKK